MGGSTTIDGSTTLGGSTTVRGSLEEMFSHPLLARLASYDCTTVSDKIAQYEWYAQCLRALSACLALTGPHAFRFCFVSL